jgi:cullin 1
MQEVYQTETAKGPTVAEIFCELTPLADTLLLGKGGMTMSTYMKFYRLVFKYVSAGSDRATFYDRLANMFRSVARVIAKEVAALPDEDLLIAYAKHWAAWKTGALIVARINSFFARQVIKRWMDEEHPSDKEARPRTKVLPIFLLANVVWREGVLGPLAPRLTGRVIALINEERDNLQVNRALLRDVLRSYVQVDVNPNPKPGHALDPTRPKNFMPPLLGFYRREFEVPFLEATRRYYQAKASRTIHEGGASVYVRSAERWLADERERAEAYLDPSSVEIVLKTFDEVCIAAVQDELLRFLVDFLKRDNVADLRSLYVLLARVEQGIAEAQRAFSSFVVAVGKERLEPERGEMLRDPALFAEPLIALQNTYDRLVAEAFQDDPKFAAALDRAMRDVVNTAPPATKDSPSSYRAAALLAAYTDRLLRDKSHRIPEAEREGLLKDIVAVFQYLSDKDVFVESYTTLLARRLITRASSSLADEETMIALLKAKQGAVFTHRIQRMVADIRQSEEFAPRYEEFFRAATQAGEVPAEPAPRLHVAVLESAAWPAAVSGRPGDFVFPEVARNVMERYKAFYSQEFKGRSLQFVPELGNFEMTWRVGKKRYTLIVSAYQMAILLLFEEQDVVKMDDMIAATRLDIDRARHALEPMVTLGVLVAEDGPNVADWKASSAFHINEQFTPPGRRAQTRVVLNVPSRRAAKTREASEKEEAALRQQTNAERMNFYMAAIVRIMKARKKLSHNELIIETSREASRFFPPDVRMIKRAIENAIEENYLARSPVEKDVYEYVA